MWVRIKLFWAIHVTNKLLFIIQSMKTWVNTGSAWSSGRALCKRLIRKGLSDLPEPELVVMHGTGCGEFLFELLRQSHSKKVTIKKVVVMDNNQVFIDRSKYIYSLASKRFPGGPDVQFEMMDALKSQEFLESNGYNQADLVISTLPYSNMPDLIEEWAKVYVAIAKRFIFYTYLNAIKRKKEREATANLIRLLEAANFKVEKTPLVYLNVPPAHVVLATAGKADKSGQKPFMLNSSN